MSRAFIKESDDGELWLSDVAPTVSALLLYLTKENNGIRVREEKRTIDTHGQEVLHMSNGLSYTKNVNNQWTLAPEEG